MRTPKKRRSPRKPEIAGEVRVRRAVEKLAEAERKFAPFTSPVEYPWISTHDKWGLGDSAFIRNLKSSS